MTRAQTIITIILLSTLFALPVYFSTKALSLAKAHTGYTETRH